MPNMTYKSDDAGVDSIILLSFLALLILSSNGYSSSGFIPLSTSFAGHTGDLVRPHKLAQAKLFRKVLPMLI